MTAHADSTAATLAAPERRTEPDRDAPPIVVMRSVAKSFRRQDGTTAVAIDDVSIDVAPGEFLVLLGPSGCGKTTLLRTLAGLEHADAGEIEVHGRTVFSAERGIELAPDKRDLSMIFQSYALWPHMTAFDNVAYPLRSRGVKKEQVGRRVETALGLVGVGELRRQFPNQMSGGQQQRVALARALVGGGDLVLFDEPLSNVDAKVRETLRRELLEMQRTLGFSAVYVTHDQHEAMELAHRVAVMGHGRVQQLGTPEDIYLRPQSRYVANFIGTSNELPGTVVSATRDEVIVETAAGRVTGVPAGAPEPGDAVVASFRPERAELGTVGRGSTGAALRGAVSRTLFLGSQVEQEVRVGDATIRVLSLGMPTTRDGDEVALRVAPADVRILPQGSPS